MNRMVPLPTWFNSKIFPTLNAKRTDSNWLIEWEKWNGPIEWNETTVQSWPNTANAGMKTTLYPAILKPELLTAHLIMNLNGLLACLTSIYELYGLTASFLSLSLSQTSTHLTRHFRVLRIRRSTMKQSRNVINQPVEEGGPVAGL